MGSFNIAEAIKAAYIYCYDNRALIVRLGTLPVIVKFFSYIAATSLGMDDNLLRKGLLLFPATMLEGYLVCTLLRLSLFPQETAVPPPGANAFQHYKRRAQEILAGTIVYSLLKLVATFSYGLIAPMELERTQSDLPAADAAMETFLGSIFLVIFMMWAFRLVWLYIPVTCGYTVREYLHKVRGFSFSFHIFSVWLLSMLPVVLVFRLLAMIFIVLTGHSVDNASIVFQFLIVAMQCVYELVIVILTSIGIGYGTMLVMTGRNKPG